MTWTIRFSKRFVRAEKALPKNIKHRNIEVVKRVLANPFSGKRLHGRLKGLRRVHVGKYRKVYEISAKERQIWFLRVDLRKRVYK